MLLLVLIGKEKAKKVYLVIISCKLIKDIVCNPVSLVDVSENPKLIYDFYNFPKHYYEEKWDHKGSPAVANRVIDLLNQVCSN